MDDDTLFALAAVERRRAADMVEGLDEQQLASPSLCSAWSVRDVVGHLTLPFAVSLPRMILGMARHLGDFDKYSEKASREVASRPVDQLVRTLRDNADSHWTPPANGAIAPLTDVCVHVRDAARPLGLDTSAPSSTWQPILAHVFTPEARGGAISKTRAKGLRAQATDLGETWGSGPELVGNAEALVMALAGRTAALDDLTGPGVPVLHSRL